MSLAMVALGHKCRQGKRDLLLQRNDSPTTSLLLQQTPNSRSASVIILQMHMCEHLPCLDLSKTDFVGSRRKSGKRSHQLQERLDTGAQCYYHLTALSFLLLSFILQGQPFHLGCWSHVPSLLLFSSHFPPSLPMQPINPPCTQFFSWKLLQHEAVWRSGWEHRSWGSYPCQLLALCSWTCY